ncbi:MAG: hypothetical protein J4N78_09755, partial [Chloroflexi bacterium]|nr:hypothetical protein [Chloroflexota bacterium]
QKLPGHQQTPQAAESVCPSEAISKEFSVAAIEAALPMLGEEKGRIYVLEEDKGAVLSGARPAEPLVLHVNVGDCIRVRLSNETTGGPVSFHADMLSYDPAQSMGIAAGANPIQTVAPGEARTYTFYAHPEVGETVALVRDWGNVLENPGLGLYGAIIVGPAGAKYTDPVTGEDAAMKSSWRVDVHPPSRPAYRDFSLFIQDEDEVIGTHIMPYSQEVEGVLGLNYRLEPLNGRLARDKNTSRVFDSNVHGDPATPIIEAMAGDRVAIHVLVPSSEQTHVFTLEGHQWPVEPGRKGSDLVSSLQVGALEAVTVAPEWGAGGREGLPGDYLYGDHREPYRQGGLWGIFRVFAEDDGAATIQPLPVSP